MTVSNLALMYRNSGKLDLAIKTHLDIISKDKFNFNSYEATFNYEVKIVTFPNFLFTNNDESFDEPAFLVELSINSDLFDQDNFFDANVFFQNNLDSFLQMQPLLPLDHAQE